MEISLIIPAFNCATTLIPTTEEALAHLSKMSTDFEILLVPNGPEPGLSQTARAAEVLAEKYPQVKLIPPPARPGKGLALKTGFEKSTGKWILFTDADLPYELSFFDKALPLLNQGYDLVSGNRRLPESRFNIPTTTLRLAYRRHQLGLAFNRCVRLLFPPIRSRDTQAGIKAMSRRLAEASFRGQACTGFLFDIEIFLTASAHQMKMGELPVELFLENEKTTVRIFKESFSCFYWFSKIRRKYSAGLYGPTPARHCER